MTRISIPGLLVVGMLLSACGSSAPLTTVDPSQTSQRTVAPPVSTAVSTPSTSPPDTACQGIGRSEPIASGADCWIEIATGDATPIRVSYTTPAPGWAAFVGAYKDVGAGGDLERVGVLLADINNLTSDPCTQQWAAAPAVGRTVEDLATALTRMPPFEVTAPPTEVTAFGFEGTHVQIRIPRDQPFDEEARTFTGCTQGVLATWMSRSLNPAFYGYAAPGDTEDFWILDVEGTRVVIVALATANASAELIAEQQAVLDSIVIEP